MSAKLFNNTNVIIRYLAPILITAIFSLFSHCVVAESTATTIETIPLSTQNEICRGLLLSKKGCEPNDQIHFIRSYPIANEKILLFFFLKNSQTKYHRGLTIPVIVDSKGAMVQWATGQSFVGEPQEVMSDTHGTNGLWMHAQYNDSGKTPQLLYSSGGTDEIAGLDWLEINLPEESKKSYQQEEIGKFCFLGSELYLTLKSISSVNESTLSAWKANFAKLILSSSRSASVKKEVGLWKHADVNTVNSSACISNKYQNSGWLVQNGETMSLLILENKDLTIKIPKVTRVAKLKPSTVSSKRKIDSKLAGKGYAIQVGAFKDFAYVKGVVTEMQQAGFKTFTKELNTKGIQLKKIYVGPYSRRDVATKKLAELRDKFNDDKGIQFSFIVPMK